MHESPDPRRPLGRGGFKTIVNGKVELGTCRELRRPYIAKVSPTLPVDAADAGTGLCNVTTVIALP